MWRNIYQGRVNYRDTQTELYRPGPKGIVLPSQIAEYGKSIGQSRSGYCDTGSRIWPTSTRVRFYRDAQFEVPLNTRRTTRVAKVRDTHIRESSTAGIISTSKRMPRYPIQCPANVILRDYLMKIEIVMAMAISSRTQVLR